ncbi:uncharacterized protein LOC118650756 [Myotis myotis]|uniref:uncharacterized protein LOC118650756 n=1 Tax=Myotis myotis TaxID=51298 RepID=UPI00174C3222|nr:uncharacterized protein LOC118650756 [Myotis myotis]
MSPPAAAASAASPGPAAGVLAKSPTLTWTGGSARWSGRAQPRRPGRDARSPRPLFRSTSLSLLRGCAWRGRWSRARTGDQLFNSARPASEPPRGAALDGQRAEGRASSWSSGCPAVSDAEAARPLPACLASLDPPGSKPDTTLLFVVLSPSPPPVTVPQDRVWLILAPQHPQGTQHPPGHQRLSGPNAKLGQQPASTQHGLRPHPWEPLRRCHLQGGPGSRGSRWPEASGSPLLPLRPHQRPQDAPGSAALTPAPTRRRRHHCVRRVKEGCKEGAL